MTSAQVLTTQALGRLEHPRRPMRPMRPEEIPKVDTPIEVKNQEAWEDARHHPPHNVD